MKFHWQPVAVLLLAAIGFVCFYVVEHRAPARDESHGRKKVFSRELVEGMSISGGGIYGVDLVSCRRARIEKMKKGFLTLGGQNVLVLEELRMVIPGGERANVTPVVAMHEGGNPDRSPRQLLADLGISREALRFGGNMPRFSGLSINGLELSVLDAQTNVVPRLTAARAEAGIGCLELHDCGIIDNKITNHVGIARLKTKPSLQVEWADGILELQRKE